MWTYRNPVRIIFGVGQLRALEGIIGGRSYALVTYGEARFADLASRIAELAGPAALTIDTIRPNPDFRILDQACRRFAEGPRVEVVLALGGGSVIDAAKVIAAARGDFGRVRSRLEDGRDRDPPTPLPLVAVPTTAGTGSEVTCWATVWDTEGQRKYSLDLPGLYATHAIVDPELMLELPRAVTISTGLDALSHALESLWNRSANPVSANHAVLAAKEILSCLPCLAQDGHNLALRERMARAALFAGLAFSNTHTALAHSLSYPVTLRHGVAHGIACSFSLPLILRSVQGADPACDAALRRIFGEDLEAGAARLEGFLDELGVSVRPEDHGLVAEEWDDLLDAAFAGERGRNYIGSRDAIRRNLLRETAAPP